LSDRAQELRRSGCDPERDSEFLTRLITWVKGISRPLLLGVQAAIHDPDDLAQEVSVKIIQHFDEFTGDFAGWAWRIVQNEAMDFHRADKRDRKTLSSSADDPDTQAFLDSRQGKNYREEAADHINGIEIIETLLSHLPDREAQVVQYKLDGYKLREIAKIMGLRQATVGSLFYRAITRYSRDRLKAIPAPRKSGAG